MKKLLVSGVALVAGVGLATGVAGPAPSASAVGEADPMHVVAAFYPIAFAAQQVGKVLVEVDNLTPTGAEPHDLELTPDQRDTVEDASLVFVMGRGFQPGVESAAGRRDGGTVQLLERLPLDDDRERGDPHVWLDPRLMGAIADVMAKEMSSVRPRRAATFEANARAFRAKLRALDDRFRTGLAECSHDTIVTAHDAFGHLANAYGLRQEGVAGISPDAEPDAKRLAELADLVRERGITTVFTEALVSPRVARTLAREAGGVKTAVLNPLEGLTRAEIEAKDNYFTVMDENLVKLRAALDCA